MNNDMNRALPPRQSGAVLVISLLLLLVMTLIGVTAMRTTTLEEKMAGNDRQRQMAFQAAETALRDGEAWIAANMTDIGDITQFDGTNGRYSLRDPIAAPGFDIFTSSAWAAGNSVAGTDPDGAGQQVAPRYIIEYMGRVGEAPLCIGNNCPPDYRDHAFRVTAIGWGADATARELAWSTMRIQLTP